MAPLSLDVKRQPSGMGRTRASLCCSHDQIGGLVALLPSCRLDYGGRTFSLTPSCTRTFSLTPSCTRTFSLTLSCLRTVSPMPSCLRASPCCLPSRLGAVTAYPPLDSQVLPAPVLPAQPQGVRGGRRAVAGHHASTGWQGRACAPAQGWLRKPRGLALQREGAEQRCSGTALCFPGH